MISALFTLWKLINHYLALNLPTIWHSRQRNEKSYLLLDLRNDFRVTFETNVCIFLIKCMHGCILTYMIFLSDLNDIFHKKL